MQGGLQVRSDVGLHYRGAGEMKKPKDARLFWRRLLVLVMKGECLCRGGVGRMAPGSGLSNCMNGRE